MITKVKISELEESATGKGAYVPAVDGRGKTVKVSLNGLTNPAFRMLNYHNDGGKTENKNREDTRISVPRDERIQGMTITYRISSEVITEQHIGWSIDDSSWKLAQNWMPVATSNDIAAYSWQPLSVSEAYFNGNKYKWARVSVIADNQYYDGSAQETGTFDIDVASIIEQRRSTGVSVFTQVCVLGLGNIYKENLLHVRFNMVVSPQEWVSIAINSPNGAVGITKIYIKEK